MQKWWNLLLTGYEEEIMTSQFLFLAIGWVSAALSKVTWLDWWTGLGRKVKRLHLEYSTFGSHRQPSSTNKDVNLDINSQCQTVNGLLASYHCCNALLLPLSYASGDQGYVQNQYTGSSRVPALWRLKKRSHFLVISSWSLTKLLGLWPLSQQDFH